MAKKLKRAFTITELVIVIAVVAILAAVLIPTFSNVVRRANESSDIQAVREMNVALANEEALNGKPESVGEVADVLRGIGYDVRNYRPLVEEYANYWYKPDNRVVLYNTETAEIVFPEEYEDIVVQNDGNWSLLNETYTEASNFDFEGANILQDDGSYDFSKIAEISPDPSQTREQYAGTALFALATQINEEKIENDVEVTLPAEVELPDYDWVPIKNFQGTLKPADGVETAVISNLNLSKNTLYSESSTFSGSGTNAQQSKYNVYGFINTVTGNSTIENITFEDVTLETPGSDFQEYGKNANVLAPIGAILPDEDTLEGSTYDPYNVTIRNVHVRNATIRGFGRVAGLVGYIGGTHGDDKGVPKIAIGSKITIENCSVENCTIEGGLTSQAYGSAGGLISYMVRGAGDDLEPVDDDGLQITINNCTVSGNTIKGRYVGGAIGWYNTPSATIKITGESAITNNELIITIDLEDKCAGVVVGRENTVDKNETDEHVYTGNDHTKKHILVDSGVNLSGNTCSVTGGKEFLETIDNDLEEPLRYTIQDLT